tara:strand:+ start:3221 stop:3499 length:279 start_codon:yes stop_codon:yes gene_type:complete
MWAEIIGTIGSTFVFGGTYYGLYKLGFHMSRKEQINKMNDRVKDIEDLIQFQKDLEKENIELLQLHKVEILQHIDKLNNHKIYKKNDQAKEC